MRSNESRELRRAEPRFERAAGGAEVGTIVAGIDVGGKRKGFHAVALNDGTFLEKRAAADPAELLAWLLRIGAVAVGVDAPCRWSTDGRMRNAERELLKRRGVHCFATPSRERAKGHPFYAWMENGMDLYARLSEAFPLLGAAEGAARVSFETFPQAVASALSGTVAPIRGKVRARRALLELVGVPSVGLPNIDFVDAALCAVAARAYARGDAERYGDEMDGWMVVPSWRAPTEAAVLSAGFGGR